MPTPHNMANKDDIAKTVIMPGDPKRATYIAQHYLDDYKLVNDVRGMNAYTGYYKGKRITVMAHGMGIPSAAIYSYELFKFYDVDSIIRIGSCGSYTNDLSLKSIILVSESYSDTNYDVSQGGVNKDIIKSNSQLNNIIEDTAIRNNINITKARVYSSDAFYTENNICKKMYDEYKCLAVEMESYAIFYNAELLNKKASCLLTVSDNLLSGDKLDSNQREQSFNDMIVLALESAIK